MKPSRSIDERTAWYVYVWLVALTLLSVSSATAASASGRTMLIPWALSLAAMKGVLIGLFYMHLIRERVLTWAIVVTALAGVLILAIGLLPDFALRLGAGGA